MDAGEGREGSECAKGGEEMVGRRLNKALV